MRALGDLTWREVAVFAPMIAIVLWIGVYPNSFLKPMQPSIAKLIERVDSEMRVAKLASAAP